MPFYFLHSAFLFILPAILIPLILFFIFRKKYPIQKFSSFIILQEFAKRKMRQLRRDHLLLYLLRTILILLIVLLFAQPLFKARQVLPFPFNASSHLFILDDSFSMKKRLGDSTAFEMAKSRILQTLYFLPLKTECGLFQTSRDSCFLLRSTMELLPFVKYANPTSRNRGIAKVMEDLDFAISQSQNSFFTIYVFSDFQPHDVDSLLKISSPAKMKGKNIQWIFVSFSGSKETRQIWVDSIEIPKSIDPLGQIEISVRFRSNIKYGTLVNLYVGEERLIQKRIVMDRDPYKQKMTIPLRKKGSLFGSLVVEEEDALSSDNTFYFNLWNAPDVKILFVTDKESNAQYIHAALSALSGAENRFVITTISPKSLPKEQIQSADVVWIADLPAFSQDLVPLIRKRLETGKGVIISLGAQTDIAFYNRNLLGPLGTGRILDLAAAEANSFFTLSDLKETDLLFQGFKKEMKEEIVIIKYLHFSPSAKTKILARIHDGSPFLAEDPSLGGSLYLILGSLSDPTSSNITRSAFFVPFVYRILQAASNLLQKGLVCEVGENLKFGIHEGDRLCDPIIEMDAIGHANKWPLGLVLKGKHILMPPVEIAGNYKVIYKKDDTLFVSANIDPKESNLTPVSKDKMEKLQEYFRAVKIIYNDSFYSKLSDLAQGRDFTTLLIALIALVLFIEIFILFRISN